MGESFNNKLLYIVPGMLVVVTISLFYFSGVFDQEESSIPEEGVQLQVPQQIPCSDGNEDEFDHLLENPIKLWFDSYTTGPGVHKWEHYFPSYHRHFRKFLEKPQVTLVEVGVQSGGSIVLWQEYFGAKGVKLIYHGLDINDKTKKFENPEKNVFIHIGDQANKAFLQQVKEATGPIDIFIDDGGHKMSQLKITFEVMWPALAPNGVYLAEDLHTCYWPNYEGGYHKSGSFCEEAKEFVDNVNAAYWNGANKDMRGLHFYDSQLYIEKMNPGFEPRVVSPQHGTEWIPY